MKSQFRSKKGKNNFETKMRAVATGRNLFSVYNQKVHKRELLSMVRVIIEKTLSIWSTKKVRSSPSKSRYGSKYGKLFFFKNFGFATLEVIYFMDTTKRCAKMSFLGCLNSDLKNEILKYKKKLLLTFEIWIWVKTCIW